MHSLKESLVRQWPVLAVIAAGIALRVILVSQDFGFILTNFVPDDAFYYFKIAQNVLSGNGSTFDGMNFTNGYHPLWLVLLLPIFGAFSAGGTFDVAPIYAALSLAVAIDILTLVVLARIASRYAGNAWARAAALAAWSLNPFVVYEILNGLETSVSLFLISLFFLLAVSWRDRLSVRSLAVLGVVGGLMVLARLDNVFYILAFLAWALVAESGLRLKKVAVFCVTVALVASPWFVWNFAQSGMLFTSASVTATVVNHGLIVQDHGPGFPQKVKAAVYTTYFAMQDVLEKTGMPEIFLVAMGMGLALILARRAKFEPKNVSIEAFLFAGFALNFIANASIRWTYRNWYFIAFNIFAVAFLAWLLEKHSERMRAPLCAALMLIFVSSFYIGWTRHLESRESAQAEMLAATRWMNENLPEGSKIGVFNAGVQAYFSKHAVVNLDGLVNNEASSAMIEKRLWDYVRSEDIDYISDFDIYLNYRYRSFFGEDPYKHLEKINTIKLVEHSRSSEGISIYRVKD